MCFPSRRIGHGAEAAHLSLFTRLRKPVTTVGSYIEFHSLDVDLSADLNEGSIRFTHADEAVRRKKDFHELEVDYRCVASIVTSLISSNPDLTDLANALGVGRDCLLMMTTQDYVPATPTAPLKNEAARVLAKDFPIL